MRNRKTPLSDSRRRRISDQLQGGEMILMVIITLVFLILSIFTLFYHNKNATNGYKLKTLQEERESLMFDIEILNRQIADVSAINAHEKSDEEDDIDTFQKQKQRTKIIYLKGIQKKKDETKKNEEE